MPLLFSFSFSSALKILEHEKTRLFVNKIVRNQLAVGLIRSVLYLDTQSFDPLPPHIGGLLCRFACFHHKSCVL